MYVCVCVCVCVCVYVCEKVYDRGNYFWPYSERDCV